MKIISYSLFKGTDPLAELFYVRGLYLNVMMNSIVYPEWKTVVQVDEYILSKYGNLLDWLGKEYVFEIDPNYSNDTHCMKMLWRIRPVFWPEAEYVICRDADALTSLAEANAVDQWIGSGLIIHGIHDNPAHSLPLLGGLCGFKCEPLRYKYGLFKTMTGLATKRIDKHGSDQDFLNSIVYEGFKNSFISHVGRVSHDILIKQQGTVNKLIYQDRTDKRWLSDLCTSFIGAAGCNEMETLRYFRSVGIRPVPNDIANAYPKIFYWV